MIINFSYNFILQQYWCAENKINVMQEQQLTYNNFGKVSRIAQGSNSVDFVYGVDGQRIKMDKKLNGINTIKYYSENYEEKNGVGYDYIYTPAGLSAIAVNRNLF